MPRKGYSKLVRDRIPEIIRADGRECAVETMGEEAYQQALLEKLVEEAEEAAGASRVKLVTELADVFEVLDAIMKAYDIEREEVLRQQVLRSSERGGFEKRIRLLWTR